MQKRILTMLLMVVMLFTSMMCWEVNVNAQEEEDVAMSEIMTVDALIGYAQTQTWGVYLSDGHSVINKISSSKVGAGGVTNAAKKSTVKVASMLERKNASGSWEMVTSWTQTNQNAYIAMLSKSVAVASGYYYRVRSYHYAGTDTASSNTSALWIGN